MTRLIITRSRKLLIYLIFVHSLMLATLMSLLAITWWSLLVTIILLVSFIYYAQQHQWLKTKKSLVCVEYHEDKGWSLHYSDQSQKRRLNLASSVVTPQLVMLHFKRRYFWQSDLVTIIDDAVDVELFRQLRVYLRTPKIFQR